MATFRSLVIAAVFCAVAVLVVPSQADTNYYVVYYTFKSPSCSGEPLYIRANRQTTGQTACNILADEVCTAVGGGEYRYSVCVPLLDDTLPVPPPQSRQRYSYELQYPPSTTGCTGDLPLFVKYWAEDACVYNSGPDWYELHDINADGTSYTYSRSCDSSCATCQFKFPQTLGVCQTILFRGVWSPPSGAALFTTPYSLVTPTALTVPVSTDRNCFAAVGSSLLGGWVVTYNNEHVRANQL